MRTHLRRLRTAKGFTQAQLADRAGVAQSTISHLEAGKCQHADFDTVARLVRVLGTTFEAFMVDEPNAATK